jgi:phage terminase large subunit
MAETKKRPGAPKGNKNAVGHGKGRPPIKINWKEFERLCGLQCTLIDIAGWFGCSVDTIENKVKEEYQLTFSEVFNQKKGKGNVSLRRIQRKLASTSAGMAIFLGKNYLGQSDEPKETDIGLETPNVPASGITSIFIKNYHSCKIDKNITINRGGTGSSKTVSLAQIAMEFLLTGTIGEKQGKEFDIVSGALPHLKTTALKAFWEYAELYKIDNLFAHHKTDKTIKFKDRTINYYSVDDEKKLKSRRRDFLWISEADTIDYDSFRQFDMRTNVHTFLDFNPDDEYIWINEKLEQERMPSEKDITVIQSSYSDNVFLNEVIIKKIIMMKTLDPEYWLIYGLGEYGSIAGLIYKDWKEYDVLPERKFITVYGQDYGFSNSHDAMVQINWEIGTRNLYIKECYYELGLSTLEVIEKTKEVNPDNDPVFGDSSEARLMKEIRQAGINLFKPKKSVLSAINLLRSFNLYIHSGSPNLLKEIKRYKWIKENGKRVNKPLKFMDDLMNAKQYGMTGFMSIYGNKYKILKELTSKGKTNG